MRALLIVFLLMTLPALAAGEKIVIIDGDTIRVDEERVRILHIDAPELKGSSCRAENRLAIAAGARLQQLLDGCPDDVTLERDGVDFYGRTLATVRACGVDVGEIMISEGFARRWRGRREDWC